MSDSNDTFVTCQYCRATIRAGKQQERRPSKKRRKVAGITCDDYLTSQLKKHHTTSSACIREQMNIANSEKNAQKLMNLRLPILFEAIVRPPPYLNESVQRLRAKHAPYIEGNRQKDDDVSVATGEPLPISHADLVNRSFGADEHCIDAGVKECMKFQDQRRGIASTSLLTNVASRDTNDAYSNDDDEALNIPCRDDDDSRSSTTSTGSLEEGYNAIVSAEREFNAFADGCNWKHIKKGDLPDVVAVQTGQRSESPVSLCSHDSNDEYHYEPPSHEASLHLTQHPTAFDTDDDAGTTDTDGEASIEQELIPTEGNHELSESTDTNDEANEEESIPTPDENSTDDSTNDQRQEAYLPSATTLLPFLIPPLEFFENHRRAMPEIGTTARRRRRRAINVEKEENDYWLKITSGPKHMVKSDQALLRLILMHDELNSPHWGFHRSLGWVQFLIDAGLMTRTDSGMVIKSMHRKTFMKKIREMFYSPPFQERIVPLENKHTRQFLHAQIWFNPEQSREDYNKVLDGYTAGQRGSAKVPICSVKNALLDLLSDMLIFSDLDNLVVNRGGDDEKENVFKPFDSTGMGLDEFLTGSWQRDSLRRLRAYFKDDRSFETYLFYLPVALFIDKTGTDLMQRHGLEPVYITTLLIKLKIRQLYRAWRPIGFIPDQELMSKSQSAALRRGPEMRGTSCRNWHMCLKSILDELVGLEKTGFVHHLQLGPYCKRVTIIPVVALIMGDAKGGDTVTGRYGSHNLKVGRQVRSCWCSFSNLDCVQMNCRPILAYQTHFPSCLAYSNGFKVVEPKKAVCDENEAAGRAQESDRESESDSSRDGTQECDSDDEEDCLSVSDTNDGKQRSTTSKARSGKKRKKGAAPKVNSRKQQARADAIAGRPPSYKKESLPFDSFFKDHPFFDHKQLMEELDIHNEDEEQPYERNDQLSNVNMNKVWDRFRAVYETAEKGGEILQLISQHQCITAFNQLSFGGDIRGIHGATPCDPLHAIKLGLLKYSAQHLLSLMYPTEKEGIDELCGMLRNQRQSERRWFPRSNYSHGVTSLTMLTADEWVGVIFTLAIIFRTDAGFEILKKVKKRSGTLHEKTQPDDLVQALEMLLAFEAWVFGGPFWRNDDQEKAEEYDAAVRKMLAFVKRHIRRDEGYGWCVTKFHEILHIVPDIQRNGRPSGYDSSIGERQLKSTKSASKTAQKQRYPSFLSQTCERITDRLSLIKAATAAGGILGNDDDDYGDESEADDVPTYVPTSDNITQSQATEATNIMGVTPSFNGVNRIVLVPSPNASGLYDIVRHVVWTGVLVIDLNNRRFDFVCDRGSSTIAAPTSCVTNTLGRYISTRLLYARKKELNRIATLGDCALHGKQINAYRQDAEESHGGKSNSGRRQTQHRQNHIIVPPECTVTVKLRAFSEACLHGRYNDKAPPQTLLHNRYDHIKKHGLLLRCHHDYRSSGAWHDWVIVDNRHLKYPVRRKKDGKVDALFIDKAHFPARLLSLVEWHVSEVSAAKPPPLPIIVSTERDSQDSECSCTKLDYEAILCMGIRFTRAIIHPCDKAESKNCSVLFDEWKLASREEQGSNESTNGQPQEQRFAPYSACVPLSSISDRVLVISEHRFVDTALKCELDDVTNVYVVRDRESSWSKKFA